MVFTSQSASGQPDTTALIGSLLDTIGTGRPWEAFLGKLAERLGAAAAQLMYHDTGGGRLRFNAIHGLDRAWADVFARSLDDDPRYPLNLTRSWHPGLVRDWHPEATDDWRLRWHPGMPFACRMLVPERFLHRSVFYRDVLKPWGIEYALGFCYRDTDDSISLTVMRGPAQPAFGPRELQEFAGLVPLLRSAITLHRRFAQSDFERRCALQVLDGIQFGIAMADRQCRIHFINRAAQDICNRRDGLIVSDRNLALTNPRQQRELAAGVAGVIADHDAGREGSVRILPVARRSGRPDYTLMISTLSGPQAGGVAGLGQDTIALLLVSDPEQPSNDAQVMPWLYRLTRAETLVLSLLLEGLTVDAIGRRLHISDHTTRTHVRNLLRKTNTCRQADLIRVVMSSPAWLLSPILTPP